MLAFITTLRHPSNSNDYYRVEQLLKETLRSVTNQTSDDFVVIVVGNQKPEFKLPKNTHFVQVKFKAPAPAAVRVSRKPFIRDKGTKLGIALIKAREFNPDYVMIFDADDFVHRDLTEFVAKHPGHPGWVVDEGWMYSRARRAFRPQSEFNRTCGTSFIIPFEAYEVPEDLGVDATWSEIRDAYGERLPKIIGAHKRAVEWYADHGRIVEPLPFKGAVYHVDTGENHSFNVLDGDAQPLTRQMAKEFGIPKVNYLRTLWACYCSETMWRWLKPLDPAFEQYRRGKRFSKRVFRAIRRRIRRVL
ncbi:glycosyltransferase [Aeromicrobium sp.]|uniref:glycosyltransferase n=1 Tax=Aeromicrobium sp. TaxID=1871063 RepID=UPI002FC9BB29